MQGARLTLHEGNVCAVCTPIAETSTAACHTQGLLVSDHLQFSVAPCPCVTDATIHSHSAIHTVPHAHMHMPTLKLSLKLLCASLNSGVEKDRRGSSPARAS